ncbi:MAG: hypothetical protein IPJ99_00970 [Betaproteobacteria bacterium]|nr:hypothetical protein [Betaproteobacteria bacterium]
MRCSSYGYGTFTEAAACATPVLYVRRDDWPEQDCLIALAARPRGLPGGARPALAEGGLEGEVAGTVEPAPPTPPATAGAAEAVAHLLALVR